MTGAVYVDYPITSSYNAAPHIISTNVAIVNKSPAPLHGRLLIATAPFPNYGFPADVQPSGFLSRHPYWELADHNSDLGKKGRPTKLEFKINHFKEMAIGEQGDGISTPLRAYLVPARRMF